MGSYSSIFHEMKRRISYLDIGNNGCVKSGKWCPGVSDLQRGHNYVIRFTSQGNGEQVQEELASLHIVAGFYRNSLFTLAARLYNFYASTD